MHPGSPDNAAALRVREVLASWAGLLAHRAARAIRRILSIGAGGDQANVAVVCLQFLRYGASQAVGLRETGLNVTLYYMDRPPSPRVLRHEKLLEERAERDADQASILAHAEAAGVHVVCVPARRDRGGFRDTLWLHRDLRRRRIATAVVQSHRDPRHALLGLSLRVALILHDPERHSDSAPLSARAQVPSRAAELTSACLIVHSPRLLEQIRPVLRRVPIGIVPHGADMTGSPAPVPRERRLLIFGRLAAYKGVDTALEAFALLPPELSDVELIVAGRGPLARLGVGQRNVEVRNEYIPESELDSLLREVRLVLLPYRDATQSGVGLNAVERGVPCVVSTAGGLPELVEDARASLVVAPEDPQGLAASIAANIDHDEGLRRAVYEHAASHFAWPVVAQRLRDEVNRLAP
jgi:glycosyltransferase involved in cell wall biosynthesis